MLSNHRIQNKKNSFSFLSVFFILAFAITLKIFSTNSNIKNYETQKQRVMKRDNISEEDFDKINNIQIKNSDKKFLCDIVINTDKNTNLLKIELIKIIKNIGIL